ncbi:glycosyltransferase family 9 protein [Mesorhizobium atlanticum]
MLQITPTAFRSILVLQTKFIGDILLASALANNLQLAYPGVRIVFLCETHLAGFLTAHGIAAAAIPSAAPGCVARRSSGDASSSAWCRNYGGIAST